MLIYSVVCRRRLLLRDPPVVRCLGSQHETKGENYSGCRS
jgi:hypothetical protein